MNVVKTNDPKTMKPQDIIAGKTSLWIFGYGSLVWKPDFKYQRSMVGYIQGYKRRFWHGDNFHRGNDELVRWGICLLVNGNIIRLLRVAWYVEQLGSHCIRRCPWRDLFFSSSLQPGRVVTLIEDDDVSGTFCFLLVYSRKCSGVSSLHQLIEWWLNMFSSSSTGDYLGCGVWGGRLTAGGVPEVPECARDGLRRLHDQNGGFLPWGEWPASGSGAGLHCHLRQPSLPGPGHLGGDRCPDRNVQREDGPQLGVPAPACGVHEEQLPTCGGPSPVLHRGHSIDHGVLPVSSTVARTLCFTSM